MSGTSVTAVLIGTESSNRPYVDYEIEQSYKRQNGIVGIYIHNMKDVNGETDLAGINPLSTWHVEKDGIKTYFSNIYRTYDWVYDRGYSNFAEWVESAATQAGK